MKLLGSQLEAFMAVVADKTVHAAAASLHMTQTAITQRIRALEAKLKTTLFIRSRRGMTLTNEGESLLHYCYAARQLEGEALARIEGAATQSVIPFVLSAPTSMMRSRIIPACLSIMKKFPHLLLQFDIDDTPEIVSSLRLGKSQLAVLPPHAIMPEMKSKMLSPEEYVLVASYAWRHRKLRDIVRDERLIDFSETDQMSFNYLKKYKLFKLARHERYFASHTEMIAMLIAAGRGYGVLTKEFVAPYVKNKELIILNEKKIYQDSVSLAWYHRPEPPAYFKALLEIIT